MKKFKALIEEVLEEGSYRYPGDDMTQKELKIAINAAKNILDMIEDGATVQRWQISAIVKASEELASVYTSMSADEEDWEDEYEDEETMYVGYEYPSSVYEETELFEEVGDYSIKKTGEKKSTIAHPDGKPIYHILHKGEVVGKIEPYSASRDKKKPGSRIVTSRTPITSYMISFENGKGPTKSSDIPMYHKMKHPNAESALNSAAQVHSDWLKKNESLNIGEGYNDPAYIRRAIPALKNAVEFHKDTMKDHDKKSVKGSAEYVRAHSAAAKAHKEAAERHRIAHAQLSAGSKDIEYYVKPARELGAYAEKLSDKANSLKEEADYKVTVDGLPDMYVKANSPSEVKNNLRKVVKNPEMIRGVERIAKASLQKMFRDKAAGKEVAEEVDLEEADGAKRNRELFTAGLISKDEFDKRMGYGKYKPKDNSKKLDGPGGLYKNLVKRIGEETDLDEASLLGPRGLNSDIHKNASANQSDREYIIQRSFKDKWKSQNPGKKWPGYEKAGFKSHYDFKEEADLEEGYNDQIHRKYISDTVHDYVAKDDTRHDKIVDHLHKAKNFGSKTADSLSDRAGISIGAAKAITKEVASNLKANFGTPQKTQTQAQRVGAYLKQKHVGPRSK